MNAPRWLVPLAAVVGIAIGVRLGLWQLDRAAQKTALQNAIESRREAPALDGAALARDAAHAAEQFHRPVRVRGRWSVPHTVFLDNRQMDARPGFFVVTPLVIEGRGEAVLVQRGWVPRDPRERTRLPAVPTTDSESVEIAGRVAPPPARLFEFAVEENGPIRQNLDVEAFARETGLRLLPLSVLQLQPAGDADDGLARRWPAPAADVQKHYGYAFQWFALAATIALLYVWFRIVRPRLRRSA